jgi:glutathione synthase/RimK-type ligase-like ATP-grasp enzyme
MTRIALLTLEQVDDFVIDDAIVLPEFARRGWDAIELPWSQPDVDWNTFDLVIVRTTWDYHVRVDEFLDTLARIDRSSARLENPLALIRWNLNKRYLRDLEARGVAIVPSVWGTGGTADVFAGLFTTLQDNEIVLKPNISGGARDTFRLHAPLTDTMLQHLVDTFDGREWFAQPFVRSVVTEGEYSLFYFNGVLSHAIRKVPKPGDFRVQEEHGGDIQPCAVTSELRTMADAVMAAIAPAPLQARVDVLRLDGGALALMELELIEPSLYFRTDSASPAHFADAITNLLAGAGATPGQ